jgi:uncharacterized membrane protein
MTTDTVVDKVIEEFEGFSDHGTLIHTNLSNEQEDKLRAAFTDDVPATV